MQRYRSLFFCHTNAELAKAGAELSRMAANIVLQEMQEAIELMDKLDQQHDLPAVISEKVEEKQEAFRKAFLAIGIRGAQKKEEAAKNNNWACMKRTYKSLDRVSEHNDTTEEHFTAFAQTCFLFDQVKRQCRRLQDNASPDVAPSENGNEVNVELETAEVAAAGMDEDEAIKAAGTKLVDEESSHQKTVAIDHKDGDSADLDETSLDSGGEQSSEYDGAENGNEPKVELETYRDYILKQLPPDKQEKAAKWLDQHPLNPICQFETFKAGLHH